MIFTLGRSIDNLWEDIFRSLASQLPKEFGYIGELGLFLCIESYELILLCSDIDPRDDSKIFELHIQKPNLQDEYISLKIISEHPVNQNIYKQVKDDIIRQKSEAKDSLDWKDNHKFPVFTIMKTLSKLGSTEDYFSIKHQEGKLLIHLRIYWKRYKSTETRTILPYLTQVDSLPSPSVFLEELQNEIDSPNASLGKISRKIQMNPSFAIEILKLANSGFFSRQKKVESLESAIMVIGLNGVRKILLVAKYKELSKLNRKRFYHIWEHSQKTAFIAKELASKIKPGLSGTAYIAGLLHDMGKLLLNAELETIPLIVKHSPFETEVYSEYLEEILLGISHSSLGGLLAKKWNFPDDLKACVEFHHRPWDSPKEYKKLVESVYLANILSTNQEFTLEYEVVNKSLLSEFNINSKSEFEEKRIFFDREYKKFMEEMESEA